MTTPSVAFIGAANLDHIAVVPSLPQSDQRIVCSLMLTAGGGPAATAAVTAARQGVAATFYGVVGEDVHGVLVRDGLQSEGVDVSGLSTQHGLKTPESILLVEQETGLRSIITEEAPAANIQLTDLERYQWVHVDHVGYPALKSFCEAQAVRPRVSVDAGNPIRDLDLTIVELYAPTESQILQRYPGATLEQAVQLAASEGPRFVVATRGKEGAVLFDGSRIDVVPAFPVDVVSTLGAGDVFHGALLAELANGSSLRQAVVYASATAALSCTGLDGRSAIPLREDVERFLSTTPNPANLA